MQNVRRNGRALRRAWSSAAAVAALAGTAAWTGSRARRAEQENPPIGRFITVGGVRLHYLERGSGQPLLLLHGNVVRLQDFLVSGLIDRLAERYRVIAFDRPGFGHSKRPRDRLWTAATQAELLHNTFASLGIERPIVLGHSWGALTALELALRKTIMAGGADRVVDPDAHARRLHRELKRSELHILPGVGHMLHHFAREEILSVLTREPEPAFI